MLTSRRGATLAICATIVATSTVSATAATVITGRQIKNGTVTGVDIKNGSIARADLAKGLAAAGPRGETGPAGATGPQGATGPAGAAGTARAYGQIRRGTLALEKAKGFETVERLGTGQYCVRVAASSGIDPATTVAFAQVESGNTGVTSGTIEVHAGVYAQCGPLGFHVRTFDGAGALSNLVEFLLLVP